MEPTHNNPKETLVCLDPAIPTYRKTWCQSVDKQKFRNLAMELIACGEALSKEEVSQTIDRHEVAPRPLFVLGGTFTVFAGLMTGGVTTCLVGFGVLGLSMLAEGDGSTTARMHREHRVLYEKACEGTWVPCILCKTWPGRKDAKVDDKTRIQRALIYQLILRLAKKHLDRQTLTDSEIEKVLDRLELELKDRITRDFE